MQYFRPGRYGAVGLASCLHNHVVTTYCPGFVQASAIATSVNAFSGCKVNWLWSDLLVVHIVLSLNYINEIFLCLDNSHLINSDIQRKGHQFYIPLFKTPESK